MKRSTPILAVILALSACDRRDLESAQSPDRKSRSESAPRQVPGPSATATASDPRITLQHLDELPAAEQAEALAEHIYAIPDDELDLVLEPIVTHDDPTLKSVLLTVLYEETRLRPPIARLPLLIEVARQPEIEPSLGSTIMAELGATLNAEHGTSWPDWILAIEEQLAETEGLIRVGGVEGSPPESEK